MMSIVAKTREVFRVLGEAVSVVPALGYKLAGDDDPISLGSVYWAQCSRIRCPAIRTISC
jgi:hypothetical protein